MRTDPPIWGDLQILTLLTQGKKAASIMELRYGVRVLLQKEPARGPVCMIRFLDAHSTGLISTLRFKHLFSKEWSFALTRPFSNALDHKNSSMYEGFCFTTIPLNVKTYSSFSLNLSPLSFCSSYCPSFSASGLLQSPWRRRQYMTPPMFDSLP